MLMLMGIGAPRVLWPEPLLVRIADAGYRVVWCDNRDTGDSPKVEAPAPSPAVSILRHILGRPAPAPYTLSAMAGDAAHLLDRLGADRAHVVGASMGGMIAHTLALEHPDRVASLTSMMSSSGSRALGVPGVRALATILAQQRAGSAEDQAQRLSNLLRALGSGRFEPDLPRIESLSKSTWKTSTTKDALSRQLAAVLAKNGRTQALRGIQAPTLVLHGAQDPLFPPRYARAQARAIPNAELYFVDGMGHDMPAPLWPEMAGRIVAHLRAHPV